MNPEVKLQGRKHNQRRSLAEAFEYLRRPRLTTPSYATEPVRPGFQRDPGYTRAILPHQARAYEDRDPLHPSDRGRTRLLRATTDTTYTSPKITPFELTDKTVFESYTRSNIEWKHTHTHLPHSHSTKGETQQNCKIVSLNKVLDSFFLFEIFGQNVIHVYNIIELTWALVSNYKK